MLKDTAQHRFSPQFCLTLFTIDNNLNEFNNKIFFDQKVKTMIVIWLKSGTNKVLTYNARVAELVDALDLGSSSGDRVGVRVSPLAPLELKCFYNYVNKMFF